MGEPRRQLRITTTTGGDGSPTVTAVGEVDLVTAEAFRDAVGDVVGRAGRVVVDLTGVCYFDSAGVKALFEFAGRPVEIVVEGGSLVRRILSIAGVDGQFPVVER